MTSSEAAEGRQRLPVIWPSSQAGQRVILVDADLRRPTVHQVLDVPNGKGLTSLLVDEQLEPGSVLAQTRFEGLQVIPRGPQPPTPSELLASERVRRRLAQLGELADVVIFDSPPVLEVSDPTIVASLSDGAILVANSTRTRGQHAAQAESTLRAAGAHVLGVVLNRTARARRSYYGYYATTSVTASAASSEQSAGHGEPGTPAQRHTPA